MKDNKSRIAVTPNAAQALSRPIRLRDCDPRVRYLLESMNAIGQGSIRYDCDTQKIYDTNSKNHQRCFRIPPNLKNTTLNAKQQEFAQWFMRVIDECPNNIIVKVSSGNPLSKKYYIEKELTINN